MISYTPKNGAKPMVGKPPAGRYVVQITEMESKRAGNDQCDKLSFKFEVVEGAYKGKVIWSKLNLNHTSADNSWAEEKVDALCYALRIQGFNNDNFAAMCYGKPVLLDVYMGAEYNGKIPYEIGSFEQVSKAPIAPLPPQQPAAQAAPQQTAPTQPTQPKLPNATSTYAWQPPS